MLYPPNSAIWFPTLVLQQGASIVPLEVVEQNAKKSGHLDLRRIQNIPLGRNWSSSRFNSNQISPSEARWVITHPTVQTSREPHHTMANGRIFSLPQLFQPSSHRIPHKLPKKHHQRSYHWLQDQILWCFPIVQPPSPGIHSRAVYFGHFSWPLLV